MSDTNYKQIIASSKQNFKDFSKHIAMYLGKEWSEKYYQKTMQRLDGKVTLSKDEKEAWDWWVETLRNPFEQSAPSFKLRNIGKQLSLIERWLATGIYNKNKAKRLVRQIKRQVG